MQPTLVILAAGMASRYGSMKQTESFGPGGETIMEYSIYDAIRAGFKKVVFIIRKDFADAFKAIIEPKLAGKIQTDYVFQEKDAYLGGRTVPADRVKPWGTGHAILCCKEQVKEPFAVINADDFYGADAFVKAYDFLVNKCQKDVCAVVAYELANTLSENGSVSRGVLAVTDSNEMQGVTERTKIYRENGAIVFEEDNGNKEALPENTRVSMNFFCFSPAFIDLCGELFPKFLDENMQNPKSEFLMPKVADEYIKGGYGKLEVITTNAKWFGVTYKEDAPTVKASIDALVSAGTYPASLWK
ncbi:sugar phosphate nucleotidyltransferase [Deminuibacter soli]|uniref:Nucleotidyltransferase n=1 Tax=Deminuibacter soli TaxID=2291815 RepID=A0A3E1NLE8_9BACT|nr:sugar phosphate nucleotidyltransferase [Deminuibacter soli]RFM28747.1 nucleotidyltransferase [Deminuibacter soli]